MKADWLLLTTTLPTRPSGLRVRVWRSLKSTGAGQLREGVYLLPASAVSAPALRELAHSIAQAGAPAHLIELNANDAAQESAFRKLFNRSEAHAAFQQQIKSAAQGLRGASAAALRRQLRALESQWQQLQATDFFAAAPAQKSAQALAALRLRIERQLSPGEPSAAAAEIPRRALADHQGRSWATRKRPWVDRLASAWLITRFIDHKPRFLWLADARRCPASALGYDFDGATFTHVADKVTFEVMAESFGLLADPALQRLAGIVHHIDVGGQPADEAAGLEAIVRGLQLQHARDDDLLAASLPLFDALHAALKET